MYRKCRAASPTLRRDLPDGIPDVQKESLPERWGRVPEQVLEESGGSVWWSSWILKPIYIWGYDFRPYNIVQSKKVAPTLFCSVCLVRFTVAEVKYETLPQANSWQRQLYFFRLFSQLMNVVTYENMIEYTCSMH